MKVKIKDKEIELKLSVRTYIYYENVSNKSFELKDLSNFVNLITFFYSVIMASAKKDNIDIDITYDELLENIDENGGEFYLVEFINWFREEQEKQSVLLRKEDIKEDDKKIKKKVRNSSGTK